MLITSTSENIQANRQNIKVEYSWDKSENNQPLLQKMNTPFDLNNIQPRSMQAWNCDETGFDTNGKWNKVICTYNFFPGKRTCNIQEQIIKEFCDAYHKHVREYTSQQTKYKS